MGCMTKTVHRERQIPDRLATGAVGPEWPLLVRLHTQLTALATDTTLRRSGPRSASSGGLSPGCLARGHAWMGSTMNRSG